jgi:hypothetical protein
LVSRLYSPYSSPMRMHLGLNVKAWVTCTAGAGGLCFSVQCQGCNQSQSPVQP